jgi:hypothetical protein
MTKRGTAGDTASPVAEADLEAFFRHRDDVAAAGRARLTSSLSRLRGSDDPVVTFASLARVCVPDFAEGCEVELSDGTEPMFRVTHPARPADGPERTARQDARSGQVLLTPFRGVCRGPATRRTPGSLRTGGIPGRLRRAMPQIADLMVKHMIALVDR